MIARRRWTALALATAVGLGSAAAVGAQDPATRMQQQQQMRLQEQVMQLNQAMQRMTQIQERAHRLEQVMVQEMTRLRLHEGAQAGQMLQQQEHLRIMAQATSEGAREMHQAMEQLRNMLDQGPMWDRTTEREFERLRTHWQEMAGRMEEGLGIMERLRDRLSQPDTGR